MTKKSTCPTCGATASGNFCASCGSALGGRHCTQCGSALEPGARFCNKCGTPVAGAGGGGAPAGKASGGAGKARGAGGASGGGSRGASGGGDGDGGVSQLAWWVAGGMMVLVIVILVLPIVRQDSGPPAGMPAAPAGGGMGAGTTDLSNMSPREAADRLFNRVMASAEANDSTQVTMFLPMAIDSYEIARPLDADGLFHLSRLQRMGQFNTEALATAREALEDQPNHILNLYAAADAALALGDEATAREYSARILEVWDAEMASGNQDYELHSGITQGIRDFAEENVDGG